MPPILTVIWFAAALGGLTAVAIAVAVSRWRREALLLGAIVFAVAGVLGILSIGIVFLGLAALCAYLAGRVDVPEGAERI